MRNRKIEKKKLKKRKREKRRKREYEKKGFFFAIKKNITFLMYSMEK